MAKGRTKKLTREEEEEVDLYNMTKETSNLASKQLKDKIKFEIGTGLKTEKQKKLVRRIKENKVIFIKGVAGTGKTFSALKASLEILKNDPDINELLITKPIVEAGKSIGFLPGDIQSKISPYMSSFYSNIQKLVGENVAKFLKEKEFVKEKILNYVRGETFDNCVAMLDEAQNLSINELKLFISRLGENSKMIIMGDTDQVDIELRGKKSGLEDAFERFKGVKGIAFHEFDEDDIVRSEMLIQIMKRYKEKL